MLQQVSAGCRDGCLVCKVVDFPPSPFRTCRERAGIFGLPTRITAVDPSTLRISYFVFCLMIGTEDLWLLFIGKKRTGNAASWRSSARINQCLYGRLQKSHVNPDLVLICQFDMSFRLIALKKESRRRLRVMK